MRLTRKKIEEIIKRILGEEGLALLDELYDKENVSEFDLATKTKKDIKVIRKMLYLLYNHNLVSFTRKKDKQKGWYVYYWTILPESMKFSYIKQRKELLERLTQRLEEEEKELFFSCPNECVRLNFDQSMDFEFHCPECGELITQDNTKEKIANLTKQISKVKEDLEKAKEKKKVIKFEAKERKKVVKKKAVTKKKPAPKKKKVVKKVVAKKKKIIKKRTQKKSVKKHVQKATKKAKESKKKKAKKPSISKRSRKEDALYI